MIDIALKYARKGWRVIPIGHKGKIPLIKNWVEEATTDEQQIRRWFSSRKNIGVVTGKQSGFWVLDIDGEEGADSLRELEQEHGELPLTITQITGSGGYHILFEYDERIARGTPRIMDGIDIRTDGNQIVVFPSIHPNGRRYEWELNDAKHIAKAPEWLIEEILKNSIKKATEKVDIKETIESGKRNHKLFSIACKFVDQGVTGGALKGLVHGLNKDKCDPPLEAEEVEKLIESAEKYEPTKDLMATGGDMTLEELLERPRKRAAEYFEQSMTREGLLGFKLGTRFKELEAKMDGIQSGMYLVGAVANVGKTILLLNLVKAMIQENEGVQVLFFSIDDHFRKIYFRLMALETQLEINTVSNIGQMVNKNKKLTDDEKAGIWSRLEVAKHRTDSLLEKLILLDETDGNSLDFIKSTIEQAHPRNSKLIVVIDNFHKIRTPEKTGDARSRFTYLSEEAKALSNKYDIPLIMTVELRKLNHSGPPTPDDLKDTVDLHYDCDVTFMLHSESERKEDSTKFYEIDGETYPIIDIYVQKNKQSDFKGRMEYVLVPKKATYYELGYLDKTPTEIPPWEV